MTQAELNALLPTKYWWLPWVRVPFDQFLKLTMLGIAIGIITSSLYSAIVREPTITQSSISVTTMDGYLALVIDRTRSDYCSVQPSRILFHPLNGSTPMIPVILPINSQGMLWPHLGRAKLILLVEKLSDIPKGTWTVQTSEKEDCHWYSSLFSNDISISKPVTITIP